MRATSAKPVLLQAWMVLFLSGLVGMLFYLDRQTLSVLKTTLKGEFSWSDTDYGWLVTAFMTSYTLSYLFAGRWIDRWGTRWTMTAFITVMSAAMIWSSRANNLWEMGAARALLGVAEAGVMPATLVAICVWFPPERRGTAATLTQPIYSAGLLLATPIAALVTHYWSWHLAFLLPGVLGFAVAILWNRADRMRSNPSESKSKISESVSYFEALKQKEIWGVILSRLISDPLWFFLIYWEPGFLQEHVGLNLNQLARLAWIPTAVAVLALMGLGFASDQLVKRLSWAPARSRRAILQWVACFAPLLLFLPQTRSPAVAITLLCAVRVMAAVWLNFTNIFMADLVPQRLVGTSIALMGAFGAATSMLCNIMVGPVVSYFGYGPIFTAGAFLHPLAALVLWRSYRKRPAFD